MTKGLFKMSKGTETYGTSMGVIMKDKLPVNSTGDIFNGYIQKFVDKATEKFQGRNTMYSQDKDSTEVFHPVQSKPTFPDPKPYCVMRDLALDIVYEQKVWYDAAQDIAGSTKSKGKGAIPQTLNTEWPTWKQVFEEIRKESTMSITPSVTPKSSRTKDDMEMDEDEPDFTEPGPPKYQPNLDS